MTEIVDSTEGVPFVDLGAQLEQLRGEVVPAIERVLRSSSYVLGPELARFEEEMAAYCGARFAVGVDSGTSALELILRALGIGPGDEVITAANSFVATAMAISHTGATPVFVDVDPQTRTITGDHVAAATTDRTQAVIPVHLYGHPADADSITNVARRHGLAVVEDACQAHGARYRDRRVGTLGVAAAFSFYPSKNLGAFGDGGMVLTSDEGMATRLRRLRNYGQIVKNESTELGYNRRLDELQAAILQVKLRYLDTWNAARCALARTYDAALRDAGLLRLPVAAEWADPVWHLFVVNVERRDLVRRALSAMGIETGVHYPIPIPHQPAYGKDHTDLSFPVSDWNARTCLSLPMFPEMSLEAAKRVSADLQRAIQMVGT